MGVSGLNPIDEEGGPTYSVTQATNAQFGEYTLVHEIHDDEKSFRHRAVLRGPGGFKTAGHWMDYSSFSYAMHNEHKYFVAMDSWFPMFPEFFQVCGPYSVNGSDIHPTEAKFIDKEAHPAPSLPFDAGVTENHAEDRNNDKHVRYNAD